MRFGRLAQLVEHLLDVQVVSGSIPLTSTKRIHDFMSAFLFSLSVNLVRCRINDFKGVIHLRLDKYLKVSRIIKRRTVANEACDAGRVLVNGKPARASYDVKVGDIIEVSLGARSVKIRVLEVSEYATKETADRLFESVN